MTLLAEAFAANMVSECQCTRDQRFIVAVSGGEDSVVLLDLMRHWSPRAVVVAHVNHGLRGNAAQADERFVARLAASKGYRFYSYSAPVSATAKADGLCVEEAARQLRLNWLEGLCGRLGFDAVALGHHAKDQAETVIMHLMRGAGLRGLAGIRPRRGVFVRPMLHVSKEAIAAHAVHCHLCFRDDESNQQRTFLRNRVRHDVIPALNHAAGHDVVAQIARSARWLGEVKTEIDVLADTVLPDAVLTPERREIRLDITLLNHYFAPVQRAVLIKAFEHFSKQPGRTTSSQIQRLVAFANQGVTGQLLELGPVLIVHVEHALVFGRRIAPVQPRVVVVGESQVLDDSGAIFACKWVSKQAVCIAAENRDSEFLALPSRQNEILVRGVEPGDRFQPLGLKGMKKVSHYLIDNKIPRWQRPGIALMVVNGEIAWVVGHRLDERFKVTPYSENILHVQVHCTD